MEFVPGFVDGDWESPSLGSQNRVPSTSYLDQHSLASFMTSSRLLEVFSSSLIFSVTF